MNTADPVGTAGTQTGARRWWDIPLWAHVALVAAVLVGIAFVADRPYTAYTSDEGAYTLQARSLETSGRWTHVDPAAPVDPAAIARTRGSFGPNGQGFYTVHPLYPLLLAGVGKVIGRVGYVAVSLLGTLLAGVAAALIGRRIDGRLACPCLWIVALGSPLLFDGNTIEGHSPAAALAGFAVVWALAFLLPGRRRASGQDAALLVGVAVAAAFGVLVRSESLLFALAVVVVLGLAALASPALRARAAIAATVVLVATVAARLLEGRWIASVLGPGSHAETAPSISQGLGFWSSRWDAVRVTLIEPAYGGTQRLGVFLVLALAASLALGGLARVRASPPQLWAAGAMALGGYTIWLLLGPSQAVPGLFVAWPFAAAALICITPEPLSSVAARLATGVVLVAGAAILATEYADGGSLQWGGRYLALLIPIAVPVLAYAILLLPPPQRRPLVACTAATAVVISAMAVTSLRDTHRGSATVFASLRGCGAVAGPSGAATVDVRPIVVSPTDLVPRLDWPDYDRYQWLSPPPAQLDRFLRQLSSEGVRRAVLLVLGPQPAALGGYRVASRCRGGSLTMVVLGAGQPSTPLG